MMEANPTPDTQEDLTEAAGRIVRVATDLFAEQGYHGVSTRQLAAAAGTGLASMNYHVGARAICTARCWTA